VDEKVMHILPAILPGVLQAYQNQDYQNKGFQASTPGMASPQTPEADEKFWGQVIAAAISAAPGVINAVRGKDFQPAAGTAPQGPEADQKFWGAVVAAAISAAPSIYQAVRGKDFQPAVGAAPSQAPVVDEKVMRILPAVLPAVLQAYQNQAYQNKGFQASTPGMAVPQAPEQDEKFWGAVAAAAISAAPSIYQAIRGKDFQLGY
jgi:hypothetical protein